MLRLVDEGGGQRGERRRKGEAEVLCRSSSLLYIVPCGVVLRSSATCLVELMDAGMLGGMLG